MNNNQTKLTTAYLFKYLVILSLPLILIFLSGTSTPKNTAGDTAPNHLSDNKAVEESNYRKSESKEVVIVIDPGHGGEDWGTYYGSMKEKNINLAIALKLGPILQEQGLKTVYTRENDTFVGLKERAEIANNLNATLFISIHNNRMPDDSGYKGTETLYAAAENSRFDSMNDKQFAKIIQNGLVKGLKTVDNGIIYRPGLAVLHRTNMPAVIAEIGYISNYSDRENLSSGSFRQKAAASLSGAIIKALGEMGASKDASGRWMVSESVK